MTAKQVSRGLVFRARGSPPCAGKSHGPTQPVRATLLLSKGRSLLKLELHQPVDPFGTSTGSPNVVNRARPAFANQGKPVERIRFAPVRGNGFLACRWTRGPIPFLNISFFGKKL